AGGCGAQVGRGCLDGDQAAAAGQGRGAGGVRGLQARAAVVDRADRARRVASGERAALGGDQGAGGGALATPGKAALGLFGPVPARVSAQTKLELLGLIDAATAAGWSHVRACSVLELADVRAHRWRERLRETGTLEDRPPVGAAVHRILPWKGAGGPGADRAVGLGRSLASPARAPRLLHRHGVRVALDAAARRAQTPGR